MAWIESHQKLEKSGKLLFLSQKLFINKYQTIGHLHALWWWALDNAKDGVLSRYCNAVVTQACGWTEYVMSCRNDKLWVNGVPYPDVDEFIPALIECGFVDKVGDELHIHDWDEYTHRYFQMVENAEVKRSQNRERVKRFRDEKRNAVCNAPVTLVKCDVTLPTKPNLTKPNHIKETEPTAAFSKEFIEKAKKAQESGFNIYQHASKFNKGRISPLPEYVLSQVLDNFFKYGDNVKNHWAYFQRVISELSREHHANNAQSEHKAIKDQPISIGDILKGAMV